MSSAQVIRLSRFLLACARFGYRKGLTPAERSLLLSRLAYLTVTNAFAALRLLPMGDRDKDAEIVALRHQITVLERQLGADTRVRFAPEDRAFLSALLTSLPREALRRLRLLVHPDTVLRWHRDLLKQRHARTCRPKRPGRLPRVRSIRALILVPLQNSLQQV